MPFGARRFTQLVYHEELHEGQRVGFYRARFVPLDLSGKEELVDEATLRRELDDNDRAQWPIATHEEQLALRAFVAQARGKTFTRAAVESVAARGQRRVIVDVLETGERAIVERFRRGILSLNSTGDHSPGTIATFYDVQRNTLTILDKYLSKPKGT